MALIPSSPVREFTGIAPEQILLIKAFLQGAVYSRIKNRKGEQFTDGDLGCGAPYNWEGTPLIVLYEKHIALGKDSNAAIDDCNKDLSRLLKAVLVEDGRHFEVGRSGTTTFYRWVEDAL